MKCKNTKQGRWFSFAFLSLLFLFLSLNFVSSIPQDLEDVVQFNYPTNISLQNVNSSEYWDNLDTPSDINTGDINDDGTYLSIDGSNADSNIDIGSYDFTTTGNITASYFIGDGSQLTGLATTDSVVFNQTGSVIQQTNTTYSQDFVFGSPQLADTGTEDHDKRMWFDKSKGAFRAGEVTGAEWDDASVGDNSFTSGYNTNASGSYSVAMGDGTTASGTSSVAMGSSSEGQLEASGDISVAMGLATTASGDISVAMGYGTEASGELSMAMGRATTASGDKSVAMGQYTTASGTYSVAMGYETTASGDKSVAMGYATTAGSNDNTLAFGKSFTNNVTESFAVGFGDKTLSVRDDNMTLYGNITSTGDITASKFIGDGSQLTNLNVSGDYAQYEFGSNNFNGSGNITTTGDIAAGNISGADITASGTLTIDDYSQSYDLGSELVTNGDFGTGDLTGWSQTGSAWSVNGGEAIKGTADDSILSQDITVEANTWYQVSSKSQETAGSGYIQMKWDGTAWHTFPTTERTYTGYLYSDTAETITISFDPSSSSVEASLDDVSVKKLSNTGKTTSPFTFGDGGNDNEGVYSFTGRTFDQPLVYIKGEAIGTSYGWSNANPYSLYVEGYTYMGGFRINGQDSQRSITQTTNRNLGIATSYGQDIAFRTNNVDLRMTIKNSGDVEFPNDNQALSLGADQDASIYYDGTNLNFNTQEVGSGLAYFSNNVSATGYITRSKVYDKTDGLALEKIKDVDEWKTEDKINKESHYAYVKYNVTDFDRPVEKEYEVEVCNEIKQNTECHNETKTKIIYPYEKTEEGFDMETRIATLEQSIAELKQINKELEARISALESVK